MVPTSTAIAPAPTPTSGTIIPAEPRVQCPPRSRAASRSELEELDRQVARDCAAMQERLIALRNEQLARQLGWL